MNIKAPISVLAISLGLALSQSVSATIFVSDLGTAAPPATIGGFTMTPFDDDTRPNSSDVTSVDTPEGGAIGFDGPMSLREIGSGWATWSHGYTGDVYYTNGRQSVTIDLPDFTQAFYLYAEPNPFSVFNITAMSGGVQLALDIDGASGAKGWGFWEDASNYLDSITISSNTDFAIGEFGISVPEPTTVALFGLGLAGLGFTRRRKQNA
ncbi:PEP-CTERM sorting domain-containing protein [Photobacterium swingsii]|uniref:PEP-CTERM sorting domain-containing protein n=1 Tax=Photobacterium swingsii TaxID=680026 RepID=UPI003D0F83E9